MLSLSVAHHWTKVVSLKTWGWIQPPVQSLNKEWLQKDGICRLKSCGMKAVVLKCIQQDWVNMLDGSHQGPSKYFCPWGHFFQRGATLSSLVGGSVYKSQATWSGVPRPAHCTWLGCAKTKECARKLGNGVHCLELTHGQLGKAKLLMSELKAACAASRFLVRSLAFTNSSCAWGIWEQYGQLGFAKAFKGKFCKAKLHLCHRGQGKFRRGWSPICPP